MNDKKKILVANTRVETGERKDCKRKSSLKSKPKAKINIKSKAYGS